MSWDLAISEHGDLVISANRDLAGVSGIDLIEQRIRIRLRLHRASWLYDEDGTLGSNLFQLIGMAPDKAVQAAPPYVREALRGMTEIVVDNVDVIPGNRDIGLVVKYRLIGSEGEDQMERQIDITLPILSVVAGGE